MYTVWNAHIRFGDSHGPKLHIWIPFGSACGPTSLICHMFGDNHPNDLNTSEHACGSRFKESTNKCY